MCRASNPRRQARKIAGRVVAIAKAIDGWDWIRAGSCHEIDTGCLDLGALNPIGAGVQALKVGEREGCSELGASYL